MSRYYQVWNCFHSCTYSIRSKSSMFSIWPLCPKSCRMGVKLVSAACQWADAYHRSPTPREKIYDTDTRARSPSKPCFNSVLEKKSCFAGVTKNMLFRKSLKFVFNEFFNLMKLCSTLMMMFLQICKHPSVWQLMCGCVISSRPKDATLSWRHPFDDEGDGDASYKCTCKEQKMSRQCSLCTKQP